MAKKTTLKTLKAKAWKLFSEYVRRVDADPESGFVKCCTCDAYKHWKQMQAGHFIPGRCNSILFEKTGVHPQCRRCNYNEGNGPEYYVFMEETYGKEEIDRLRMLRHITIKLDQFYYQDLINNLTEKLKGLPDV